MRVPDVDPLAVDLTEGELELLGRLPGASNGTFLAKLTRPEEELLAVYKPLSGERPLWDFPDHTLGLREVAAHQLSRVCGFDVVPVTELVDGPLGTGSLQAWVAGVDADELLDLRPAEEPLAEGWFAVLEGYGPGGEEVVVVHADDLRLRRLALFDAVVNNADRKGGHVIAHHDLVLGVDHGLTFHPEPKLRTLLWGWAGEELDEAERRLLESVLEVGVAAVAGLLSPQECDALAWRAGRLLREGRLPETDPDHSAVPWPPF